MTLEYENHYTRQAISAKNVYDLYIWWKDVRPNRPDPYEISGWSAFCDKRETAGDGMFRFDNMDDEERKLSRQYREKLDAIEKSYEEEDEEMMIKLIKIRQDLWT
jgi:hypothetical protein